MNAETVAAVDTETPNIGVTISANDIQHMPSFNRDVFTLTQLAPGAISDGSQACRRRRVCAAWEPGPGRVGASGELRHGKPGAGERERQQNQNNGIAIDGISTVSAVWGGAERDHAE